MRYTLTIGNSIIGVLALVAACGSDGKAPDDEEPSLGDGVLPAEQRDAGVTSMDAAVDPALDAGSTLADAAVDAAIFADSCQVSAPTACPSPMPTYATVAPVFKERCVVCHAGNWNGPWPLDSYRHVADWKEDIRSNLLLCTMPPPNSGVQMTRDERLLILTWIRCNIPM